MRHWHADGYLSSSVLDISLNHTKICMWSSLLKKKQRPGAVHLLTSKNRFSFSLCLCFNSFKQLYCVWLCINYSTEIVWCIKVQEVLSDNARDMRRDGKPSARPPNSQAASLSRARVHFSENAAPFRGQQPVAVAQCPIEMRCWCSWREMRASSALMRQCSNPRYILFLLIKLYKSVCSIIKFY
jgi:hypothetical protein